MIVNDRINNILAELNISVSSDEERQEMAASLSEHFNKVIIETLILSLNEEQVARFKDYMASDTNEELEQHVMQMSAEIPGMQFKIEEAIQAEFESLKAAKKVLDNR